MQRAKTALSNILTDVFDASSIIAPKQDKDKEKQDAANLPAVMWRDPGDMASL